MKKIADQHPDSDRPAHLPGGSDQPPVASAADSAQSVDPVPDLSAAVLVDLSLGSNLGDRLLNLREALNHLSQHPQIQLLAVSSVYETDPVGFLEQPEFFNIVARLLTTLSPYELLTLCQQTEALFLRERTMRWGPRTLDIDILNYDRYQLDTPQLTLPHPRMHERAFVLLPLQEINTGQIQRSASVRPIYSHWYEIIPPHD